MRKLVALGGAALLTACGGAGGNEVTAGNAVANASAAPEQVAEAPRTSACDLLTPALAQRALGMAVVRLGDPGAGSPVQTCSFGADTQDITKLQNQVSLSLTRYTLAQLMPAEQRAQMNAQPVEGLGDAALYSDTLGLMVEKEGTVLTFLMMGNGYDKRAVLTDLAREIVPRF